MNTFDLSDLQMGPQRPELRKGCEVHLLIGLPGNFSSFKFAVNLLPTDFSIHNVKIMLK